MFKEFKKVKSELDKRRKQLRKDIEETNRKFGKRFDQEYGDKLLELDGLQAYQIKIKYNPECCVCSDLDIHIKVTEDYREKHGEEVTLDSGKEYLRFDLNQSELYPKIEDIVGQDFALRHIRGSDLWVEDDTKTGLSDVLTVKAG